MDPWAEKRRKGLRKVRDIQQRYRNRTLEEDDMNWLFLKANSHCHLAEIADRDWARHQAEIMAKNLEIKELERQLKERQ